MNSNKNKLNNKKKGFLSQCQTHIKSLLGIRLFCWNWNFFAENTVDNSKS